MKATICSFFVTAAACFFTANGLLAQEPAETGERQPARGSLVEDRSRPQAARSRRRPLRIRRGGQGGRSLAIGDRTLSRAAASVSTRTAARQSFADQGTRVRSGPHAFRGRRRRKKTRTKSSEAQATLKMGVCFFEARNYGKCFKIHARRDREVPRQPAGQSGLLLHRPGTFPARALQPGDLRAGASRHGPGDRWRQAATRSRPASGCSSRSRTPIWPPWGPTRSSRSLQTTTATSKSSIACQSAATCGWCLGSILTALGKAAAGQRRARSPAATTKSRSLRRSAHGRP